NGQGPLWNRTNMATGYVAYGPTMAGTNITDVGGASLACLSCHDGITTFDSIINAPGKGMTIPEAIPGFPASAEWAWGMFSNPGGAQIELDHFNADPTLAPNRCGYCHPLEESNRLNIGLGPGSSMPYQGGSIASLSNDHPINVVYATDGRASLRSPSTVISSITLDQPNSASVGRSDNIWSVNGYLNNTATISELLRDGDKVQCASCHDPHYKNQTNTDPGLVSSYSRVSGWGAYSGAPGVQNITDPQHELNDGLFLRRVGGNSNSGVCRTCHAK
ncbi:MAG: hypothetical protein ACE5GF_09740, partial [Thermodesulfobacteriota bacterium]